MNNPFDKHRQEARPTIDLRAWCEEQNRKPLFVKMSRWYYVATNDDTETVTHLEGSDADNLRALLAGKNVAFHGWPAKRMDGYRNWLLGLAQRGMTGPLHRDQAA
jgi:hypothetical protein